MIIKVNVYLEVKGKFSPQESEEIIEGTTVIVNKFLQTTALSNGFEATLSSKEKVILKHMTAAEVKKTIVKGKLSSPTIPKPTGTVPNFNFFGKK